MQAVIVSVDYADFLKWTLPAALPQFGRLVVVTEEHDTDTISLCKFHDTEYITTGGNKGEKINAGLERLSAADWVVQLDADIWLPPQTMRIVGSKPLDHETLYGMDRCMCQSSAAFMDFLSGANQPYHDKYFTVPPFPIGARVSQHYKDGYYPIGYFQMWHPLGSAVFTYPTEHKTEGTYARTDILMAKRFQKRQLLAEPLCIHLEEGTSQMGANWNGRTTPTFGDFQAKSERCRYEN